MGHGCLAAPESACLEGFWEGVAAEEWVPSLEGNGGRGHGHSRERAVQEDGTLRQACLTLSSSRPPVATGLSSRPVTGRPHTPVLLRATWLQSSAGLSCSHR